jgi:drug/metabolite transporter (DMT)-like permease
MLAVLVLASGGAGALRGAVAVGSALALFIYAAAFSGAYLRIDAGLGALVLFGAVQVTMFAGAMLGGERPGAAQWLGGAASMVGLAVLAAPGAEAPDALAAALMTVAGAAWGAFSLLGRRAGAPLPRMASAFALAAPLGLAMWALWPGEPAPSARGAALAALSGAVTSGCGYAIWYAVLPHLRASVAAVAQTAVPLIALAGGAAFLGETAGWRFAAASALIIGGVAAATLLRPAPGR